MVVVRVGRLIKVCDVTSITGSRCSRKSIGMAGYTLYSNVCSGQAKIGIVMIEGPFRSSIGVTGQARRAGIGVSKHFVVFIVRTWIGVAGDTGKFSIVVRILVAIHAVVPGPVMRSAIYREILIVVFFIVSRLPPGLCGVA